MSSASGLVEIGSVVENLKSLQKDRRQTTDNQKSLLELSAHVSKKLRWLAMKNLVSQTSDHKKKWKSEE